MKVLTSYFTRKNLANYAVLIAVVVMMGAYFPLASTALGTRNQAPSIDEVKSQVQVPAPRVHDDTKPYFYNFEDMANGPISSKVWEIENGNTLASYNREAQTYTNRQQNVRVEDGALVIQAMKENINNREYSSARINSRPSFHFTYGTLEVTAMLPRGVGTWPAAWLMPANDRYDPNFLGIQKDDPLRWAANGEIDFLESIGSLPGQNIPAAHSYNEFQRAPTVTPVFVNDAYTTYHRYGIIKTPNSITFTIDGVPYAERIKNSDDPKEWPYDQAYYLILNLALGGSWAGIDGIDDASAPWQYKVKSISYLPLAK